MSEKEVLRQGWKCTGCGAVWSPDEKSCPVCSPKPVDEDKNEGGQQLLLE